MVEEAPKEDLCYACNFGASHGVLDKCYLQKFWHSPCWQGTVKNRHRTIRDNATSEAAAAELVNADQAMMKDEHAKWRLRVAKKLPTATKAEQLAAQRELKAEATSYAKTEKIDQNLNVNETIVMNEKHYQRHFLKWEWSDDEDIEGGKKASKGDFKKKHAEQQGVEDTDSGTEQIRFKNPKVKTQSITGVSTRNGVSQKAEVSDEVKDAFCRRAWGSTDHLPLMEPAGASTKLYAKRQSVDGDGSTNATTTKFQSKKSSPPESDEDEDDDDEFVVKSSRRPATPAKGIGASQAKASSECPSTVKSASAKGTGAKVVVLALDDPDFESTKPVEKWSSVEFLAAKSNLKFRAAVQVARVQGKQSMTTKLGVLMRQVASKSCDLSDLTQNPEGLKKELESAKTVACTLDQECMQAKKNTYEELRTRLESGTELIDELKTRFDEVEAALQFKLTEAGKNSQKEYQSNFWQLTRSSKHLEKGGHSAGEAKHKGKSISQYNRVLAKEEENFDWTMLIPEGVEKNPTPEQFDITKVACFFVRPGVEADGPLRSFASMAEDIQHKCNTLQSSMLANPTWKGSQGVIDAILVLEEWGMFKEFVSLHPGAKPICLCWKSNANRQFPRSVPFAGSACILYGVSEQTRVAWVHLFPIGAFLAPPLDHHKLRPSERVIFMSYFLYTSYLGNFLVYDAIRACLILLAF